MDDPGCRSRPAPGRVGQQAVARIRPPGLPQDLALQSHGREATDLVKAVAAHSRYILRQQHLDSAVAIKVAKPDAASRSIAGSLKPSPQLRLRILRSPFRQLHLAPTYTSYYLIGRQGRGSNLKLLKSSRDVGGHSCLTPDQFAIGCLQHQIAVDQSTNTRTVVFDS